MKIIFAPFVWVCKDIKSQFNKGYEEYKVETDQVWIDRQW